jgi:hypothetical protein
VPVTVAHQTLGAVLLAASVALSMALSRPPAAERAVPDAAWAVRRLA